MPLRMRYPYLNENLELLTTVERQPVKIPLVVVNPIMDFNWTGDITVDDPTNGPRQDVILCSPSTVPGTSGGLVVDREGYGIAVHVGRLFGGLSVEIPLLNNSKVVEFVERNLEALRKSRQVFPMLNFLH